MQEPHKPMTRLLNRFAWIAVCVLSLVTQAHAEKRTALVIGNAKYAHAGALANPANDANDIAAALKEMGFNVVLGLDLDKPAFDAKVRDFASSLSDADTAVLFYAGHGLQVAGRNYLVPIDADLKSERDLDFQTVSIDFILKQMELDRDGKTNIIFLDACRDNPLARNLARSMGTRSASLGKGLAEVQTGVGTFVAYSTQPGNVALDGTGRNSPFAAALTQGIRAPGRNLTAMMIGVRKQVLAETEGKQVPWDHSALVGDFYFNATATPEPPIDVQAANKRLKELEEQLKAKADQQSTVNLVKIENLKERVRQIDEANKDTQQQLFDIFRSREPSSVTSPQRGRLQLQMVRRNQEKSKLLEEIKQLEGPPAIATDVPAKQ